MPSNSDNIDNQEAVTGSALGAELKAKRLALGFTLRDVEAITDGEISNSYLSQLEGGKIKNPSAHVIICLCAAYAIPFADALAWMGRPAIPPPNLCRECGRAMPLMYAIDTENRHAE